VTHCAGSWQLPQSIVLQPDHLLQPLQSHLKNGRIITARSELPLCCQPASLAGRSAQGPSLARRTKFPPPPRRGAALMR
jgi:hypothetical protein